MNSDGKPEDLAWRLVLASASRVPLKAGQLAFPVGAPCQHYLLLERGQVAVKLCGRQGRDILLYRVTAGNSCVLTTSCLLGDQTYPAYGVVEQDGMALALSRPAFLAGLAESAAFRQFVFADLGGRLATVLARFEVITSGATEARLAAWLLDQTPPLCCTHQQLADELGTVREVVSRHLKRFEHQGLVMLERGLITVRDRGGLLAVVQSYD